jgi:hypothetical protein
MAVVETPAPEKGDNEESPAPAPSASNINDKAAAANAPAKTAGHETPEAAASVWFRPYESYGTSLDMERADIRGSFAKARVGALIVHLDVEVGPERFAGKPC